MTSYGVATRDGTVVAAERWGRGAPAVVLLHANVADRRSWYEVAGRLAEAHTVIAYDRRGFGGTAPSPAGTFSHLEDLLAVLDDAGPDPVWLVGSSRGGGIALDAAIEAPGRVAGLVLLAPGVTGGPDAEMDDATRRLDGLLDAADAAGDVDEVARLETWLWLDGPGAAEGRVGGPARTLLLDMLAVALRNELPGDPGATGVATWDRLDEVRVPVLVACGALDLVHQLATSQALAGRLERATYRELAGVAHLPYLEQPALVASLVTEAVAAG